MANQFLSLSLFLMLLSFFIVMNNVSSYEDYKSKPIMNSLSLAFSNTVTAVEGGAPVDTPTPRASLNEGDALENIEGLFNANIEGFEVSRNRIGSVMHVRTPIAQFENAINLPAIKTVQVYAGERGSFLNTMISLLKIQNKGKTYRLDMIVNLDKDPSTLQESAPKDYIRAVQRVSDLATTLEREGLPTQMLSVGLTQGQGGYVDLFFHEYTPFEFPEDAYKGKKQDNPE